MGFLFRLASRNLFRSKLRTAVSIAAIAFGVMIVVFARGLVVGMTESIYSDHIYYNSGHIKIVTPEYHVRERLLTLDYPIDGFAGEGLEEMMSALRGVDGVDMVIPRLKFGAMVSTDDELVAMSGWGIVPDYELKFTDVEDYLVEGRMVQPGQREVVMGTALLEEINKGVGDKVTILFNTAFGSLQGVTFTIVGRIETGLKLLNEVVFYLPLDEAQRLLEMEGEATELLLVTPNREKVPDVLPEVEALLARFGAADKYVALSYKETSDLISIMEISEAIFDSIYIFLVLLSCIVVVNTMIMIVRERTREIGMMSALGLESREILQLFAIEGGLMGVVGSLVGAVLGHLINSYLARVGLDYGAALSEMSADTLLNTMVHPVASIEVAIYSFVLGVVVVTIACFFPARRAAGLEPTEALREG
ncbi:MAG: FtsX-like permease family protein [Bacillota bacterium]|nr:ABC transporter permease [Bacillota bacterium]HOB91850.1 ABC transporter permease [Bacillota bacterium]HPZ55048.1 ABC transporter permease [Bacillota bacterium]HQD19016.1 ABC transporter permease [Bacillota bacterium]